MKQNHNRKGMFRMAEVWIMGEMLVEIMRPEADMQLYEAGVFRGPFPSGAPAICIDTVARLGHSAGIIGGVGKDDFGKCLLDRLKKDGVDCSHVLESDENSTGCAFVTYFKDGSRKFIYHIGNTPAAQAKAPKMDGMQDAKYFHIMGCSLMAQDAFGKEIVKTMNAFYKQGTKISFDPNIRPELLKSKESLKLVQEVLEHTSVFLPGVPEILQLTGKDTVEDAVKACFENPNMEIIALKNGSKGCIIYTRGESFSMGVYPVQVADSTGAGDSFDGAFLCGLIEGRSLKDTTRLATAAASLNTAAFGPMEGKISKETVAEMIANGNL